MLEILYLKLTTFKAAFYNIALNYMFECIIIKFNDKEKSDFDFKYNQ